MKNKIAVVICTHNRKKHLLEAVKSIRKIKQPKFRLVVIDSSEEKLSKRGQKGIDSYIHDKNKKPLSAKRNIAVRKIDAEIIAFTDDDCIAEKDWLLEITSPFEDSKIMCVTGRTIPSKEFKKSEYEKLFSFDNLGLNRKVIKKHFGFQNLWRFGHGNNMAFRKSVFKEVGLFDEKLGVGTKGRAGEDVDMFYRIYKRGYKILFNPLAVIIHKHVSKEDITTWARNNTYASHLVLMKHQDLNSWCILFLGVFKLASESIIGLFSKNHLKVRVKFNSLIGWMGIRWD